MRHSESEIENYIAKLPSGLQGICKKLHRVVRTQMPEAHEMIYHGTICFSTSPSKFSPIVYIGPQRAWVNLGFFFGADIPDPKKLLLGEGKRMRHIKIRNEVEADNPAIKRMVKLAWKKGPEDIAKAYLELRRKNKE
jgi:hypothetical protein